MEQFTANAVKRLLSEHNIKPNKSMGQCFLTDSNITDKMVKAAAFGASDGVLEAGPGLGALTFALSRAAGRVTAVELDGRIMPLLRHNLEGAANVDLIQGDIMKQNLEELVHDKMPGLRYHVCANLPYNITTPVLSRFIEADLFETLTVMIQKEVAARLCAKHGTPDYGAFTVFTNYHTEPETLFTVPPECFTPRPAVYSGVIRLKTRKERILAPAEEPMFFRVVRAAFGQRRKTLVNALHAVFGNSFEKGEIAEIVRKCGFDERIRGESLDTADFAALSKVMTAVKTEII